MSYYLLRVLTLVIIVISLFTPKVGSQEVEMQTALSADDIRTVDGLFGEYSEVTPGVCVSIIQDGKVVLQKSYGAMDIARARPIDSETVFSVASVSKQFTALGVLLLESEGKLSLDDDVRRYIPELPNYGKKITLEQLANHTSGLRSHLQLFGMKGLNPHDSITKEMVFDIIVRQKSLNFEPGAKFGYSNSGYSLLAEVITRVSGISFAEFTKRRILRPLNMSHSYVVEDFREPVEDLAVAYNPNGEGFASVPTNDTVVGSSGLFTNMNDLTKWVQNFSQPRVGTHAMFAKMASPGLLVDATETNHGMGQFIGLHRRQEMIFHAGADAGFVSFVVRFPERKLSVALLGNCSAINAQQKSLQVADLFLLDSAIENREAVGSRLAPKTRNLPLSRLAVFEGTYFDSDNQIARRVKRTAGGLIYQRPEQGGRETMLLPLNDRQFCLGQNENVKVVFDVEKTSSTMYIVVDGAKVEKYERQEFVSPTVGQLAQFQGHYYSEELDAKYIIGVANGKLMATVPVIGQVDLQAIQRDGFCAAGYPFSYLKFSRSENGKILGFRVSTDRAKDVYFKNVDR